MTAGTLSCHVHGMPRAQRYGLPQRDIADAMRASLTSPKSEKTIITGAVQPRLNENIANSSFSASFASRFTCRMRCVGITMQALGVCCR